MFKKDLFESVSALKTETKEALQLVYDTLNHGQQQKILKEKAIKDLFDRYGVDYGTNED
jgi:hypothetical protein